MSLSPDQRGVLRGMMGGALFSVAVLAGGFFAGTLAAPVGIDIGQRLALTLKLDLFVLLWPLVMVGNLARQRFFSAQDIDGSGLANATPHVRTNAAVLQNTLEQSLLAIGAHLVLAVSLPSEQLLFIPWLVFLFAVGRFFFWRGYAHGAAARAFGFATTFYPTVAAYLYAIGLLATQG